MICVKEMKNPQKEIIKSFRSADSHSAFERLGSKQVECFFSYSDLL